MDDAKLKAAEQWDYFDEWLARIRDIRASGASLPEGEGSVHHSRGL